MCRALREAAARGYTCAVTGDAADELLGGYNFTQRLDEAAWEHNRQRMAALMHFGSVPLGEEVGGQGRLACGHGGAAGACLLLPLLLLHDRSRGMNGDSLVPLRLQASTLGCLSPRPSHSRR